LPTRCNIKLISVYQLTGWAKKLTPISIVNIIAISYKLQRSDINTIETISTFAINYSQLKYAK